MLAEIVTMYYTEHTIQYDKVIRRDAHWKNPVSTGACLGSVIFFIPHYRGLNSINVFWILWTIVPAETQQN